MFEQLISYQAGRRPEAVALIHGEDRFSFTRMAADIGRCAAWLETLDLPLDALALICTPHPYLHWVLSLALEQAGVVSTVSAAVGEIARDVSLLKAQVLFTSALPGAPPPVPTYLIDQAWIDGLWAYQPTRACRRPRGKDDPCRIIVTSGTTGSPKKILLTRAMIDERIQNLIMSGFYSRPDLTAASIIGLGSVGGFLTRLRCWAEGGTMCEPPVGATWPELLSANGVNLLRLAPAHLQALLRDLPEDFTPRPDLILGLMGGSISPILAAETRRRLTGNIVLNYGATEVGTVAVGRLPTHGGADAAAGFICPWAEVEVVGKDGGRVADGEIGELRIRAGDMSDGYLDNPEASAAMFRDGWFWPGDLGFVSAAGQLTVVGRTDDLMNMGGTKFLGSQLEALVLRVEGVQDAAAFLAPDDAGLDAPHIAYVADDDLDLTPLRMVFTRALGREARLLRVDSIPRNAMGKTQRDRLRQLLDGLG